MANLLDQVTDTVRDTFSTTRPDLDDVLDATIINNYSAADTQEIRDILTDIYNGSDTGREMLRDAVEPGGTGITFDRFDDIQGQTVTDNAYAYAGAGRVHMDMAFAKTLTGIDENGETFALSNTYVVTHEMVHALTGRRDIGNARDGDPDSADRSIGKHYRDSDDYEGDTERFTKTIMDEMGLNDYRVSYDSVDGSGQISVGDSFTDGETVNNGVVSYNGRVDTRNGRSRDDDLVIDVSDGIDPARRGDIQTGRGDDVVHARGGDDTIEAGAGNDRVYAGSGDDRLIAGPGSDAYDGGTGTDTADYSSFTPTRLGGPMVVVAGGETGLSVIDTRGPLRADHVDTLRDVEIVVAPAGAQVARIETVDATRYIDMGAGADTAEITGDLDGAFVLDLTDGIVAPGEPGAGRPYGARITNGSETLYLGGVADDAIVDTRPAPAPEDAVPQVAAGDGSTREITPRQMHRMMSEDARDPALRRVLENSDDLPEVMKMLETLEHSGAKITVPDPLPAQGASRFGVLLRAGEATLDAGRERTANASEVVQTPETDYDYAL